jgi:hypothetical protein
MATSIALIRQINEVEPHLRDVLYSILEEMERQQRERVTKDDFAELKQIVANLALAQEKTEAKMGNLVLAQEKTEAKLGDLVQAQEKTEAGIEQLIEVQEHQGARIERLTLAQEKTEAGLNQLIKVQELHGARIEQLTLAQEKTETRIIQLIEAQETLGARMEKLVLAQEKTEKEVAKLARGMQDVQKQMGGLSHAVGYGIEDRLMPFIPAYARRTFGLDVQSMERTFIETSPDSHDEINILAKATDAEGEAYLVGECKAQPGKKDADRFQALLLRLGRVLPGRIYPLLVGYSIHPSVQSYIHQRHPGIKTALTYEIERAGLS